MMVEGISMVTNSGDDSEHELDVVWRMGEIPCPRCGEMVTAYFSPEGVLKQQESCWSCPPPND